MASELILVSNPGSASRKYALYKKQELLALLHFEYKEGLVSYSLQRPGQVVVEEATDMSHLTFAATKINEIFLKHAIYSKSEEVGAIGLRVVAPSSYFQSHRVLDKKAVKHLRDLQNQAMLHINATLQEYELLSNIYKNTPIIGASDSNFHSTMPEHNKSYAIPQDIAKKLDVWRYGYHGLSVSSVVKQLKKEGQIRKKIIVCHLGSGVSVTALLHGKTINTTMGFSPLEGTMMATRSGNIDPTAVQTLRKGLGLTYDKMQQFLNLQSGLTGVSGSSGDVRELLKSESSGDRQAKLALDMYVAHVQQSIGSMVAALGGIESLVFTGTVGQRSSQMRTRICTNLRYLGLYIDPTKNRKISAADGISSISHVENPLQILIVPTLEESRISDVVQTFI